jgi:hypothetical protein
MKDEEIMALVEQEANEFRVQHDMCILIPDHLLIMAILTGVKMGMDLFNKEIKKLNE